MSNVELGTYGLHDEVHGTLVLIVHDPLGEVARIDFFVTDGSGIRSAAEAEDDSPSEGVLEKRVILDPASETLIEAEVVLNDSTVLRPEPRSFPRTTGLATTLVQGERTERGTSVEIGAGLALSRTADGLRPALSFDPSLSLLDFREVERTETEVVFRWTRGSRVTQVEVFDLLHPASVPGDPWPKEGMTPTSFLRTENEYRTRIPLPGSVRYLQFEPRDAALEPGVVHRLKVEPVREPPTVAPRFVLGPDRDTADVLAEVGSTAGEEVRLHCRIDGVIWSLVTGEGSDTSLFVPSGTEVGPAHSFSDGSGTARVLDDRPLLRDAVRAIELQAEGRETGQRSGWVSLALPAREQPWLEAVDLTWSEDTDRLYLSAVGGAFCAGARFEIDDDPLFTSPEPLEQPSQQALADGQSVTVSAPLGVTDRRRRWFGRVTPYNRFEGGSVLGLAGQPQRDSAYVDANPAFRVQPRVSQAGSWGTVALEIHDPEVRATGVFFKSWSGGGGFDAGTPGDGTWTQETAPPYSHQVGLSAKHNAVIAWAVRYTDEAGAVRYESGTHTFDADTVANVGTPEVSFDPNGQVVVSASGDEDTERIYYRVGIGWAPGVPTTADRYIDGRSGSDPSGVVCGEGGTAFVKVRGYNAASGLAPVDGVALAELHRPSAPPQPRIEVSTTQTSTTYSIAATSYRGTTLAGRVEYRDPGDISWRNDFDGNGVEGSQETAIRARPAAGSSPTWVELRAWVDGVPSSAQRVEIPAQVAAGPVTPPRLIGATADRTYDGACNSPPNSGGVKFGLEHTIAWTVEGSAASHQIRVEAAVGSGSYSPVITQAFSSSQWTRAPYSPAAVHGDVGALSRIRYRIVHLDGGGSVLNTLSAGEVADTLYSCTGQV